MLKMAISEHLKMRHTFGGKLPVIAPVFSLGIVLLLAYGVMEMAQPCLLYTSPSPRDM